MLNIVGFYCLIAQNTQITLFSEFMSPSMTLCYCIPNFNERIFEFLEAYDQLLFLFFEWSMLFYNHLNKIKYFFLLFDNSEIIVYNDHNTVFVVSGLKINDVKEKKFMLKLRKLNIKCQLELFYGSNETKDCWYGTFL